MIMEPMKILRVRKKDYLVEMKGNMLKASVVHKEGDKYIHKVRNGQSYDRVVVDPNKVLQDREILS